MIGSFSVEVPFRTRNCTSYIMLTVGIIMWLRTLKLQWPRSTYVMRVTQWTTIQTSVTEFAASVRRHHPVLKVKVLCCMQQVVAERDVLQNHLNIKVQGKLVCQCRYVYQNCSFWVPSDSKYERFKRFYINCYKGNLPMFFAAWLHWNLARWQTDFWMFSSIRNAHRTLKTLQIPLILFLTSYVLRSCVQSANQWMTSGSFFNSLVNILTCFEAEDP